MDGSVAQGRRADPGAVAVAILALGIDPLGLRRRYGMLRAMSPVVVPLAVNAEGVLWSRVPGW